MSDHRFPFPACIIAEKGHITPEDVRLLRRHLWPEGLRIRQDALVALALHEYCDSHCPEWTVYLVEAVTEFIVWRDSAMAEVSDETADWLIDWLTAEGTIETTAGLEILLHVLDVARSVPNVLSAALLDQVRLALLPEPRGAYAHRRRGGHAVEKQDLAFLWRVLRSAIDRGAVALSPAERRVLNDINRAAAPLDHHPGWREMMSLAKDAPETGEIVVQEWQALDSAERSRSRAA